MIKEIFITTFNDIESASKNFNATDDSKKFDFKVVVISITVAISLLLINYCSSFESTVNLVHTINPKSANAINKFFYEGQFAQLNRLTHWNLVLTISYLLIPIFIIKIILKEPLKDYGLNFNNGLSDYKLFLIMLVIMIPVLFVISFNTSFQTKYPFYQLNNNEPINYKFLIWEIEYFFQFFTLEFFFRGFLLQGLKNRFGYYSVFIMTLPYCMIHFAKPMPEAIAAIIAGIVLGTFALRSKNIWLGVFIHCSIAITMDIFALWQKNLLHF
ncbi:CPBP family glutamic-type intramembrane protease [Flavobacterium sp.]|uniref:CPBP family glutamic-type intramembrane protease n=1 Tax=Flavobacterium sp. TaxID=239 RepID=UPI002607AC59|nr:CPBP family glutamic-type intramembrane protease [Flavobacterium sp.]